MNTSIILGLGRVQPPTAGHKRIFERICTEMKLENKQGFFFIIDGLESGKDKNKNPLTFEERLEILKGLYPEIRFLSACSAFEVSDIIDVMGYKASKVVIGEDRAKRFSSIFEGAKIISLNRNDTNTIEGISATKARKYVIDNNYNGFQNIFIDKKKSKKYFDIIKERIDGS